MGAFRPRLHVVTGKGGVGKSTVAAAIALAAASAGQRVLAVELERQGGLSRALDARPPEAGQIVTLPSGVAVSYFEGSAALAEYLERIIRLGPLLGRVRSHPLYRAFVGAAPGLAELMVIGKVRDELLLRKVRGRTRWDTLVLDAGSTGHALELLRMPSAAASTFRSGRVHGNARRIHSVLGDPDCTRVHVVATPEEMPIAEAVELIFRLNELGLPLGALIVNACRQRAPDDAEAAIAALEALPAPAEPASQIRGALLRVARRELGWARVHQRAAAELETRAGVAALRLPLLQSSVDAHGLSLLAPLLAEVIR